MSTLLAASLVAFVAAALLVLSFSALVRGLLGRYEREWRRARRGRGQVDAIVTFLKLVLCEEGRKLAFIEQIHSGIKVDAVRAKLDQPADEYLGDALFEGLGILVVGSIVCLLAFGPFSLFIPFALAATWALLVRPSLLNADGEKRSQAIYRRIPYTLDLAVLVLQAGGTLREALEVASRNNDPLAEELRVMLKEVDSGAAQSAALRHLSDRIGIEALDSIVLAVNRGEETGAPMVNTLMTQAELFRERRLQELEKLAVEAPTKMNFPNMLVMFAVLILILGPLLVNVAGSGLL